MFQNNLFHFCCSYTLDVEAVSCDELYFDCTQILETTQASPLQLATFLRKEIKVMLMFIL